MLLSFYEPMYSNAFLRVRDVTKAIRAPVSRIKGSLIRACSDALGFQIADPVT